MFRMLDRKGVGLAACNLVNYIAVRTEHGVTTTVKFSVQLDWCLCFLGSVSTTQLNGTRSHCIASEEKR